MTYVNNTAMNVIMTTAIEGGSAYWMNDSDVCRNVSVVRNGEHDVTLITCETDITGEGWVKHTISAADIRRRLGDLKNAMTQPEHLRSLAKSMLSDPDYDYDAGDADVALQYALFSEIVFG